MDSCTKLSVLWLILSSLVVIWDAGFVLLRPRTLPGGDLHQFWKPYSLYIEVDQQYGDTEDPFVIAQSWLNLVEVVLSFAAAALLIGRDIGGVLIAFFVSSLTFWKTVLYMVQYTPLCNGSHRVAHITWNQLIFLFLIPNGVWIVFPFMLIVHFGCILRRILTSKTKTS